MGERERIAGGVIAGIAAAICCAVPLLIVALGTAGLVASLSKAAYVVIPALLIAAGLVALMHRRRGAAARACCDSTNSEQGPKS